MNDNKFFFPFVFLLLLQATDPMLAQVQESRPNILWMVCEDISPYIGAYGNAELSTPNIDRLAKEGVRYTHAYTTAGVCAPSRSAIITGMYQTSIGTQHQRTNGDPRFLPVPPYSAVIPDDVKCFPEYLRKAGYYCSNNMKQDYQFEAPVTVWDENGPAASFHNRPKGKPFFSIFNLACTHESMLFSRPDSLQINPDKLTVPPIFPDLPSVRHDIARLYTNIQTMDKHVGEIIEMLKKDGLYDNTIIFFFSDHGGALPRMKRELLERGTHIPFIIRYPGGEHGGTINDDLISTVDLAPSILSFAGVEIPAYMQGQAFLGNRKVKVPRQYVFAARDRMDTEYDRVRMVRDRRNRYLYNYMPEKPYYQNIAYRLNIPMMKDFLRLKEEGKLDPAPAAWFTTKPVEELYDMDNDPFELHNLAENPAYENRLIELRKAFQQWISKVGDRSEIPEREMILNMWDGKNEPPDTVAPDIIRAKKGVIISCDTKGASIGYQIVTKGTSPKSEHSMMQSWDFAGIMANSKNGQPIPVSPVWQVYSGEVLHLQAGDTLRVNAMRIGYKAAKVEYINGNVVPIGAKK